MFFQYVNTNQQPKKFLFLEKDKKSVKNLKARQILLTANPSFFRIFLVSSLSTNYKHYFWFHLAEFFMQNSKQ